MLDSILEISSMRLLALTFVSGLIAVAAASATYQASSEGPYHVLQTAKVGGDGGFDYVYADSDGRKLYVPRSRQNSRVSVFNLDTL